MKYKIDYEGLEQYLKSITKSDFQDLKYDPNGIIESANLMCDIDFFKQNKLDLKPSTIIEYGEPFLVDALGGDISICVLTKRKFKLPTGRMISAKLDRTIIHNCHETYGTAKNGCWVIPEKFLIKK